MDYDLTAHIRESIEELRVDPTRQASIINNLTEVTHGIAAAALREQDTFDAWNARVKAGETLSPGEMIEFASRRLS
jgi:hypothetical protein